MTLMEAKSALTVSRLCGLAGLSIPSQPVLSGQVKMHFHWQGDQQTSVKVIMLQ